MRLAEVVVFQYDRFVHELDLQVWEDAAQSWSTVQHLGEPGVPLPKVILCRFPQRSTTRLRLAQITNGPSFTEVEAFEEPFSHPPQVALASDANGGFIGMVCDAWGSRPVPAASVQLAAQSRRGPWQASGRSDDHGLFFVSMPLSLTGQIAIEARLSAARDSLTVTQHMDAANFQYGFTPANLKRKVLSLAGQWRFAVEPPALFWKTEFDDGGWAEIKVPAHFEMEGFRSVQGIGGYRRHFATPGGAGRLKLRFDGVYSGAEVWVNGHRLAYHEGGALPFEIDITDEANDEDNVLAVRVTEHTPVSDSLDKMSEYADFPLAGIFRDIVLFRVPTMHIGALALSTGFDPAFKDATLRGRIAILNESSEPLAAGALAIRLQDPAGRPVAIQADALAVRVGPWQRTELDFVCVVPEPQKWDAEHPELYGVGFELADGPKRLDVVQQRIGFRQTEVRGSALCINGRPVKIRGTCHHDSHPLLGRAVTAELARQDLELMKEANLNSLRTSHYPPLPALFDLADELGIYVEDEGSFCWADAADDLRLTPRLMQLNAELLARDRNHPSVFIWSDCNESAFGYGFDRSHEWLRTADPSRPAAGSYDRGVLEILARHNPITTADIASLAQTRKPVLWDECWCVFQGIFGDVAEMWVDPGIRDL